MPRTNAYALALLLVASQPLLAQNYPTKPIRLIVPFPPGGIDVVARPIIAGMSPVIGQPIVIDHRPGANGMIGSDYVARNPADGYTLLFGSISTHVTPIYLTTTLPYDPVKDFTPISMVVDAMFFVTVPSKMAVNSIKDLIDLARRNPGKLSYSSSGMGSIHQMIGEQFKQLAGVDILHVPYKGAAAAQTAVIAGEVSISFLGSGAQPLVQAGTLKHLAVLDDRRFPIFPDVPAVNDTLPEHRRIGVWMGFFGPAGMPRSLLARLNAEINKSLNSQDVSGKLTAGGLKVIGSTPEEFSNKLKADIELIGRVVRTAGIKPE